MFETVELGRQLSKEAFAEREPELRTRLLELQKKIFQARLPVIVLVNGVDGAGKGDVVNLLNDWMDTRSITAVAFGPPTEEERHRPPYWRYWMALPPAGRSGIFTMAWYSQPIADRAEERIDDVELGAAIAAINNYEKTLTDDGALVIKLWLHISRDHQKQLFKKLRGDERSRWRVTKGDVARGKKYDSYRRVCERVIRETSSGDAPWELIEAHDRRHRDAAAAEAIIDAIERRLDQPPTKAGEAEPARDDPVTILDTVDLTQTLAPADYKRELEKLHARLNRLSRHVTAADLGVIVVFEGADAAGKGGAIRRIMAALDARHCRVIEVAAPTDEEKAQHYMWRFWRHLPRLGRFTVYDRSWYGRVLVERVEGFCPRPAWIRAYQEINQFEEQLVDFGIVLTKFWLQISSDEQLRRFEKRERTPWKQYKISGEDYRNRQKANQYEAAASDMIERTSTEYAPWSLVASEDKRHGRIEVLRTLCDRIEAALEQRRPNKP